MNPYNDTSIETLRLQSPEDLGRQRVYTFADALIELERSLHSLGLSLTDELPTSAAVSPSQEEIDHQFDQMVAQNLNGVGQVIEQPQSLENQSVDAPLQHLVDAAKNFALSDENPLFDKAGNA